MSGILGSIGPVLTPFYLNYGLSKEELLATAAAARAAIHLVKVAAYAVFGVLTFKSLCYGVLIGVAAFPGNWLGQLALERTSEHRFRQIVTGFVVMSAVLMLWQQREFLGL
ncbi:TSUP family transporter [Brasilonema bromeliae]|uniref:TSUP family transporter n=1 Tax=Brasilonema bromeliae TaxID=383615 RepID=UPI001FE9FA4E|nr:TSUP family transporter [Brasilonema bromeliae]